MAKEQSARFYGSPACATPLPERWIKLFVFNRLLGLH
jgi:hypothetical protein